MKCTAIRCLLFAVRCSLFIVLTSMSVAAVTYVDVTDESGIHFRIQVVLDQAYYLKTWDPVPDSLI